MQKGLSPLIATVLLIAFTIAVAGLVSNFLIGFSETQTEETTDRASQDISCAYSGLFIREAEYTNSTQTLTVTVRNSGRQDLTNFRWNVIFDNNTQSELTMTPAANITSSPGDENVFSNASFITTCSDVSKITFRSDTCPNDARDEITDSQIDNC